MILDWAKRADSEPFSSLGVIDRVVYPNFEPLISLAAAAVAERIRLMTTVVLAPLRDHFKPGADRTTRPACFVICQDATDIRSVLMA